MKKFSEIFKCMMPDILSLSLVVLVLTGFSGCRFNRTDSEKLATAVDAALAEATNKAGISVAVYKGGDSLWTYAAGCADCAESAEVDMTTATPTFAYSLTKTFISALILTQIESGLYSLTDTVGTLLSGNAGYTALTTEQKTRLNTAATVEQLLKHTSGMPNYADNIDALIPLCDPAAAWEPADILADVVYLPYDESDIGVYEYSNTNYILLGMIAEEEGGSQLNTLLANTFINPLGIIAAFAPQDTLPENMAHPYDDAAIFGFPAGTFMDFSVAIKFINNDYDIYTGIGRGTWAAGGIVATAEDLVIWGWELYSDEGDAVTSTVRNAIMGSVTEDDDYGYGVIYNDFTYDDGTEGAMYGHSGSAPGYKTQLRYEAAKGISIAIITNINDTANNSGLIDQQALMGALFNIFQNE